MAYAIDERVGCIAIIDTEIGRPGFCLHRDDQDVIEFWNGKQRGRGKRRRWVVPRKIIRQVKRKLASLQHKEGE